jgi:PEP-CTERM motif
MAKRLAVIAVMVAMLFIPALAKADSYVAVTLNPALFEVGNTGQDQIISMTFTWDTTTQVISDVTMTGSGIWQGVEQLPSETGFTPNPVWNFINKEGDIYQIDYLDHEFPPSERLSSTPGTYLLDLFYTCSQCSQEFSQVEGSVGFPNGGLPTATVTSLGDGDHDGDDPVSTPEPGSLLLLGAGITALAFAISLQKSLA